MAERRPGKRALKAQREARRAELSARLADLLRALGLGASALADLVAAAEADEAGARALLARHAGRTAGDERRIGEALAVARDLAALQEG
ncbi:MAG: hypothetical protein U0P81_03965 [Holophagaceae bacterium]